MARTFRASLRTSMMVTTAAAALILVAPIGAVAQVQAQQIAASEYDIASMPMDSALNELAKQSGKQIVV